MMNSTLRSLCAMTAVAGACAATLAPAQAQLLTQAPQMRTGTDALVDDSAHWNGELHVRAAAAGAFGPLSVGPAIGFEVFLKAEIEESVQVRGGDNIDRSAVAAIAAVGSTARDEFLPAEAHGAGTAVPGRHVNVYFVDKHNSRQSLVFSRRSQSSVGVIASRQSASGCTLMTRPLAP